MVLDRLIYEVRLRWGTILLTPCLIVAVAFIAFLLHLFHGDPSRLCLSALEMLLPPAVGGIIASIITQEPALELQLSMPRRYQQTVLLRIFLVLINSATLAFSFLEILLACKLLIMPSFTRSWPASLQFFLPQLIWLAPLLWFAMLALCLALFTRSMAACGTLLGIVWLIDFASSGFIAENAWLRPFLLFPTFMYYPLFPQISRSNFILYWLFTRIDVFASALVLFLPGCLLLRNTEGILQAISED
ncbi:hypothetical protein EPA93_23185 [Ktedonosporobacter rubrisoli]|uniref:Uncharacterized protein n=1 Tax=Ktedonosporobacter rubrisoli TaxID=2509675 RepID=A0A4P6JT38_KTERU|nr:hypothetical protein [Ktedonosporobacter rubrisoli]QBD78728.1 hypothetical protein EPA93_23185 [Ktedonosporobacter rubrisoli]